ncbi:MAG TPA: efflux RND transporter periplasmic adaptor subunit, partial [Candidatus Angelobacter sp.]|nr:efflux RND transporter periplasmic adaptor subunit [Candidatus Angelobacter sp.]
SLSVQVLIFFGLTLLMAGCGGGAKAGAPTGPQAFPVKVVTAQSQVVPFSTDYLATLKSRNAATLQPIVEGDIMKIFVTSGQRVEAGAPVLEIDQRKQEATVNNQEASLKSKEAVLQQATVDLNRKKQLFADGVLARADLDTAQHTYDAAKADAAAAEASIREQQVQLHYYTVRAPAAGIIGDIPVHVGDHVTPQTMLTTVDEGGTLEAYINVPAEKSAQLRMGMPVDIVDDTGKTLERTKVSFISPHVDTDSQTLLVKTQVPNPNRIFRNAQQVHARVVWSEKQAPVIPMTAVTRLSGKMFAFVAEGQGQQAVAKQRVIQVGDLIGNDYVVLDGIKAGDKVIVSNVQMLADGMPVAPQS